QRRRTPWWVPPLVVAVLVAVYVTISLLLPTDIPFGRFGFPRIAAGVAQEPSVLILELGDLPEWRQTTWEELFGTAKQATFGETLTALHAAQHDESIRGLYLRFTGSTLGWAMQEELWDAISEFRRSGKFVYAYVEVGGENDYALALAADSLFMPREGYLELNGFAVGTLFYAGFLQKLGISYHVEQFEEYKSAGEPLARRSFSSAARQNLRELLQERYQYLLNRIRERRGISEQDLQQRVFPRGIQRPDSLKAWGLIDSVAYETEVLNLIAHRLELKDTLRIRKRLLSVARYLRSDAVKSWRKRAAARPAVAVVYGMGAIVPGREIENPLIGPAIASEDFIETLREAEREEKVGAIILRIDSPGGSVLASDAIWTELRRIARQKPIYASLGNVAASGGYYLAMGCDTIVSHPATLTGSIGVILALPNFAGTLQKLDLTVDTVLTNPDALFAMPFLPYREREKQRFRELGADVYQNFLQKVALRRGLSVEQVREYARGRVWTGEDAYRRRLVDTLGGLTTAIALAKRRLGVPEDKPVAVQEFPRRKEPIELLWELFRVEPDPEERALRSASTVLFAAIPPQLRSLAQQIFCLWQLSQREPVLMALPWWMLPSE
ncbi:MAG: signal peptide peptidase SppA, partial [Candidatus Kapabacteria bacterium]|nr:signal peptide peptidase SppA [Candidatus Kapabacteria bacterium]MDW7996715.1 signal peptide peptidase SppA [Bacteroidota bacterium]